MNLAVATLFVIATRNDESITVVLYKSNSSKRHGKHQNDLEVYTNDQPLIACELKDKPFTVDEVKADARDAHDNGFPRFGFIAGYGSSVSQSIILTDQDIHELGRDGFFASCIPFEGLLDTVLLLFPDIDYDSIATIVAHFIDDASIKPETAQLAYSKLRELGDGL